jgi:hypothetical protein
MHQPDEPNLILNFNRPSVVSEKEQQSGNGQSRADNKENHPPHGVSIGQSAGSIVCSYAGQSLYN